MTVSARQTACPPTQTSARSTTLSCDKNVPRERLTPGDWPNSILKEMFDMGSISLSTPLPASGGAA